MDFDEVEYLNSQVSHIAHHLYNVYHVFDNHLLNSIVSISDINNFTYNKLLYAKLCYFLQLANNINKGIIISNMKQIDNLNIPDVDKQNFDDRTIMNYDRKYFKVLFDIHDINYTMNDSDEES